MHQIVFFIIDVIFSLASGAWPQLTPTWVLPLDPRWVSQTPSKYSRSFSHFPLWMQGF